MHLEFCKPWISVVVAVLITFYSRAQNGGSISGIIRDKNDQKLLAGATILLNPGNKDAISSETGVFRFYDIEAGSYSLTTTNVGYKPAMITNLAITSGNENTITIELEPEPKDLPSVTISGRRNSVRAASLENPLSVQRLTTEDIKANPGGNFDISKVIQSLPGVGGGPGGGGFRNDIVIRGGAPSENVFYLDGIEIPVINHFSTQGSGGGPQGILNVSFIEDVKLSTSAFDARYDNTLSSVFQFKQKNGNSNRLQGNIRLSATELAATFDGPVSRKTTFLVSARRSYLQLLFQVIDLPIRPNFWDFQVKTTTQLNKKTTLNFIGIGAIDEFRFVAPAEATPEKLYVINSNPIINQWSYTVGASLRKLISNGYWNFALSRNTLNNSADKFEDNQNPDNSELTLRINSAETENKLRFDVTNNINNWKLSYGASLQYIDFDNRFFQRFRPELTDSLGNVIQDRIILASNNNVDFVRYGGFMQAGTRFLKNRLSVNVGIRMDANSLENSEANPFKQFSPRLGVSYALSEKWNVSASYGIYYRLPSYTQLAYVQPATATTEAYINPGKYIKSTHAVAGLEFLPDSKLRFTLEGFYKLYRNYPVSILDGISIANKGTEFGAIGNEPIVQQGKGTAYGIEVFAQQKLSRRSFGILSYTWYHSKFSGLDGKLIPAAWDNRHLLSITWGYKFKRNWELGVKFRVQGSAPYSPYDMVQSQLNYLTLGTGVFDYSNTNTLSLKAFNASDIRIDKKWNFRRFTIDVFLDITNWYSATAFGVPQYTFKRNADNTAFVTTDGQPIKQNGTNAIPLLLPNEDGSLLPTIGFIIEF